MSDPDEIYRKAALDHYLGAHEFGDVTRVSPPWTWALLLLSLAAVGTALVLSVFTRIGITDRAPAVLEAGASETGFHAVSFLPERYSSFIKRNDLVKLELEQFPHTEFGTAHGRIVRIGNNLASAREIRAALGEDARLAGPVYRIEIAILPSSSGGKTPIPLKAGMLADVRYTVRRDRPILILFPRLRGWLS